MKRFLRSFISRIALAALLATSTILFSVPTSAAPTLGPYTDGAYYIYTVTDGKATITDVVVDPENLPHFEGDIVIPKKIGKDHDVVAIGPQAFASCTDIESIRFPDTVTHIDASAFANCIKLKSIELPDKLETVYDGAFDGCVALESIDIPETVTFLGGSAFANCTSLKSITVPSRLDAIRDGTFLNCSSLEEIELPDTVTFLGISAFYNCTKLKSIVLPKDLKEIGEGAFAKCSSLADIELPDKVVRIEDSAFDRCVSLSDITIPEKTEYIGAWAFKDCEDLKTVTFKGNTVIKEYSFLGCSKEISFYCLKNTSVHKYALKNGIKYQLVLFDTSDDSFTVDTSRDTLKEIHEQPTQAPDTPQSGCKASLPAASAGIIMLTALAAAVTMRKKK